MPRVGTAFHEPFECRHRLTMTVRGAVVKQVLLRSLSLPGWRLSRTPHMAGRGLATTFRVLGSVRRAQAMRTSLAVCWRGRCWLTGLRLPSSMPFSNGIRRLVLPFLILPLNVKSNCMHRPTESLQTQLCVLKSIDPHPRDDYPLFKTLPGTTFVSRGGLIAWLMEEQFCETKAVYTTRRATTTVGMLSATCITRDFLVFSASPVSSFALGVLVLFPRQKLYP